MKFHTVFFRLLIWIVPLNAILSTIALWMPEVFGKSFLTHLTTLINFPVIMYVSQFSTGFLKSPNVNWYIATPMLSLVGSFLWSGVFAILIFNNKKKQLKNKKI